MAGLEQAIDRLGPDQVLAFVLEPIGPHVASGYAETHSRHHSHDRVERGDSRLRWVDENGDDDNPGPVGDDDDPGPVGDDYSPGPVGDYVRSQAGAHAG